MLGTPSDAWVRDRNTSQHMSVRRGFYLHLRGRAECSGWAGGIILRPSAPAAYDLECQKRCRSDEKGPRKKREMSATNHRQKQKQGSAEAASARPQRLTTPTPQTQPPPPSPRTTDPVARRSRTCYRDPQTRRQCRPPTGCAGTRRAR